MCTSEFILYSTEDGKSEIKILLDNESQTIWLNLTYGMSAEMWGRMQEMHDFGVAREKAGWA